jgi:multidrug resistance efflux pump
MAACNAFAAPSTEERLVLAGTVHATESIVIDAPVTEESGLALRWLVADGTTVAAGERVAELDAAPFLERVREGCVRLASAEAQAKLATRSGELDLAGKELSVREHEIGREKAALRAEVPAALVPTRTARAHARELVRADAALEAARRALVAGKQTLALEAKIRGIELASIRDAVAREEAVLAKLVLVAPRAGVVRIAQRPEGRMHRVGDTVEQGQRIATMPDLAQPMEVVADLADVDDGRIAVGATATCTLDAFPAEPHACTVVAIAPIARAPSPDSRRRTYAVRLSLAVQVRPGLSAKVTFGRAEAFEAMVNPTPIEVTGELIAKASTDVTVPMFRDRGYFTVAWLAADGTDVTAGEPVVRFDDSELVRQIDDASLEIAEIEQRLAKKRSEVALAAREADLRVREAEATVKRATLKTEVPPALVAALDLRALKLDAELARITLAHTRAQVAFAKRTETADLEDLGTLLAQTKRRRGELIAIRPELAVHAPTSGTFVTTRKVGDSIYVGDNAGLIVELTAMHGVGVIDEVDLGRVQPGMPVTLRLAALPDGELRGTLAEVTSDVLVRDSDPSKVVRVKLALDASAMHVRPGMQFRGTLGGAR